MLQEILLVALLAGFSTFTPEFDSQIFSTFSNAVNARMAYRSMTGKCEYMREVCSGWVMGMINQVQQPKLKELIMENS